MRTERNIKDEVVVKLTPEGERVYTMNCLTRDTLFNSPIYSFSLKDLIQIFGGESYTEELFENGKIIFPGRQIDMRWEGLDEN